MIKPLREKMLKLLNNVYDNCQNDLQIIAKEIQNNFKDLPQDTLVAVRSSSTLEDLSKMAGAGLFDSFLNIRLFNTEQLIKAIVDVWLSLFTERAIMSRNQYKISS